MIQDFYILKNSRDKSEKLLDLLRALFVYLVGSLLCVIVMLLMDLIITKVFHHESILRTHFHKQDYIKAIGIYKSAFLIVVVAPIVEEIAFRLFLKPTRLNVSLSITFLVYVMLGPEVFFNTLKNYSVWMCILGVLFTVSYSVYKPGWDFTLNAIQNKLLLFSSVSFGLLHVFNFYPIHWELFFLYPIYITPQLFMGFIAGIIRIKNGFIWSLLLHIIVNSLVTLPGLFW